MSGQLTGRMWQGQAVMPAERAPEALLYELRMLHRDLCPNGEFFS